MARALFEGHSGLAPGRLRGPLCFVFGSSSATSHTGRKVFMLIRFKKYRSKKIKYYNNKICKNVVHHKKLRQKKAVKTKKDTKNTEGKEKKRKERIFYIKHVIPLPCFLKEFYRKRIHYPGYHKLKCLGILKSRRTVHRSLSARCGNTKLKVDNYDECQNITFKSNENVSNLTQIGQELLINRMRQDIGQVCDLETCLWRFSGGFAGFTYSPPIPKRGWGGCYEP